MKYLALDYGTKKIGIALSDERGVLAFPHSIIPNNKETISYLGRLINQESIGEIVIGESIRLDGTHNILMDDIHSFIALLESEFCLPVSLEKEWLSSVSARAGFFGKGNIAHPKWTGKGNQKKRSAIDDNAAAIILQRYLDKKNK